MAHLTGSFSSPYAGMLEVTLEGDFYQGTRRDAGFPSGTNNMLLRGIVGSYRTPAIDRYAPTTAFRIAYPGGNATWALGTEELARVGGGVAAYGFQNLKLTATLVKR